MLRHGQFYFVKCVRPSTPLNNSSETTGPVFFKFLLEPSVNGGLKIYTNSLGPLIKIAAIPIYGETLKNLLLQNQESFKADSCYRALGTQGHPNLFK